MKLFLYGVEKAKEGEIEEIIYKAKLIGIQEVWALKSTKQLKKSCKALKLNLQTNNRKASVKESIENAERYKTSFKEEYERLKRSQMWNFIGRGFRRGARLCITFEEEFDRVLLSMSNDGFGIVKASCWL